MPAAAADHVVVVHPVGVVPSVGVVHPVVVVHPEGVVPSVGVAPEVGTGGWGPPQQADPGACSQRSGQCGQVAATTNHFQFKFVLSQESIIILIT